MDSSNNELLNCNRRDFLKVAGIGAAALTLPGLIRNASAASVSNMNQEIVETDVLIIGGGVAGTFAALKAKKEGVDVTLADKGTVGKSGMSPWFGAYSVFEESSSVTRESYIETVSKAGEYLVYRDYLDMFMDDSNDRYQELVSWGAVEADKLGHGPKFREQVQKNGIRLIERTMITELLEKDGKVVGAVGFPMEEDKAIVIKAKAVVLCSGSGAFKPSGFPISPLTHDGDTMAYRVGAEISGKEFVDFHWTHWENPADVWGNWGRMWGEGLHYSTFRPGGNSGPPPVGQSLQAHSGEVPLFMGRGGGGGKKSGGSPKGGQPKGGSKGSPPGGKGKRSAGPGGKGPRIPPGTRSLDLPVVGGSTAGAGPHKCEGIFPKDARCSSNVPGLFAAGDALCTAGASYSGGVGSSSSGSAVQGGRAGMYAAEYAKKMKSAQISNVKIAEAKKRIFEPRSRSKGYSPQWVTQVMQGIMIPYYVTYVKKQDRLEAALANIEFLRDHFAPNLMAVDTHDLRRAQETKNMILNAEMKLRASLFRTESRGAHYREDFPEKDDKNWLAWVLISQDGDRMKLTKKPVPNEWRS
ncbi:MAG: FAD-binding protein [Deltaproteobacteria bacterium]|nr:FAD-binding protein [Deltaproteobacteria bacterium]